MTQKVNKDIRDELERSGVYQWELAKAVGYSAWYFSAKMREEFPAEVKKHYLDVIKKIAQSREG